jgi:cadmium resistance protein CadD (predicted permease)
VDLAVIGKAVGMFAVTNVDDLVVLTLLFGRAPHRAGALGVVAGQYLGFAGILVASVAGAAGTDLLPRSVVAYLGLLPLALGSRAGWRLWSRRHENAAQDATPPASGVGLLTVATVTFANGGDNIGVYLPLFATTSAANEASYCIVFLVMVGLWCAAGRCLATRRPVAEALSRWGHIVLPVVLLAIGALILVEGGAFGL